LIPYTAPLPEDDRINVQHSHPMRELAYLLGGLLGGLACLTLLTGLLINSAIDWLPPSLDISWQDWPDKAPLSAQHQRLQTVTTRLHAASGLSGAVYIHWDANNQVNAVSLPGRHMVVYNGLLTQLKPDDDELAFVIGHELGHIAHRDHWRGFAHAVVWQGLCALVTGQTDNPVTRLGTQSSGLAGLVFSREQELAADRFAVQTMRRAGYNPQGGVVFFRHLQQLDGPDQTPDFLLTHPSNQQRIAQLQTMLKK
jgi:predicted Zn-dependent protease